MLKKSHFHLQENVLKLTPDITKNHKSQIVTIPNELMPYLESLQIDTINETHYVFSTKFMPGKMLKDSRYSGKKWSKLRAALKLPKEIQFYSLKDTGIKAMIDDGFNLDKVRDQARHSSLEVTNKYALNNNEKADEEVINRTGKF